MYQITKSELMFILDSAEESARISESWILQDEMETVIEMVKAILDNPQEEVA